MVTERSLRERGASAGLRFERRVSSPLGYFGVLLDTPSSPDARKPTLSALPPDRRRTSMQL
jgi:hypothetical protein